MGTKHLVVRNLFIFLNIITLSLHYVHALPTENSSTEAAETALELLILHNNDMHARFEQTSKYSTQCHPDEIEANQCYGGFARVSTLLKKYRAEANNGGPPVLYLNAGDTYTGTPYFAEFKSKIVSDFLNMLKPDAACLGNHEFDLNVDGLVPLLNDVNFPILCSNLNVSRDHALFRTRALKKSVILNVKEFKVGIIGYLTPETISVSHTIDIRFISEVDGITEEAAALKKKGVNIIIALGHSGYEVDQEIARDCPEVDLVVGGHSNTFLYSGEQPDAETIDGPYPTVVVQKSGKKVPIVQAFAYTKYLGELKLRFDKDGNLLHWDGQPILVNSSIEQDPDVLRLLDIYKPRVDAMNKEVIGVTKVFLNATECRSVECNLGNLITDAMVYTHALQYKGEYWTDAGLAFMQGGGIRASGAIGNLTHYDLTTILPFNNTLILVNVTGETIVEALERSVERYTGDRGEFLQMSGIQVRYNLSEPSGHRVKSVKVVCTECSVPTFYKLDLNEHYGLIISDFVYDGGDDFKMFKKYKGTPLPLTDTQALYRYLVDFRPVYPAVEWRITLDGRIPHTNGTQPPNAASFKEFSILLLLASVLLNFLY